MAKRPLRIISFACLMIASFLQACPAGRVDSIQLKQGAAQAIPTRWMIDKTPLRTEALEKYGNIPKSRSKRPEKHGLYLQECLSYLIGGSGAGIPGKMDQAVSWLEHKGYRVFRIDATQGKAMQAVLANDLYVLALAAQVTEREKTAVGQFGVTVRPEQVPLHSCFTVVRGYSPLPRSAKMGLRKGEAHDYALFHMYDFTAAPIHLSRPATDHYAQMFHTAGGVADKIEIPGEGNRRIVFKKLYLVVPADITAKHLNKTIASTMERVPLKFKLPSLARAQAKGMK